MKLLDRVRLAIRSRHYSRRTEQAYVHWIRRYIVFHDKKHPSTMGAPDIAKFLAWLATERRVSSSTQNQAFSAILFLYKHVLRIDVGAIEDVPRGKMPHRLPVVLSVEEVGTFIQQVQGTMWIVVALLYGAGLRLQECLECASRTSTSTSTRLSSGGEKARRIASRCCRRRSKSDCGRICER